MNGLRPVIGRNHYSRQFAARTCEAAFGTPFVVKKRRMPTMDEIIGAACVLVIIGIASAWAAGLLK